MEWNAWTYTSLLATLQQQQYTIGWLGVRAYTNNNNFGVRLGLVCDGRARWATRTVLLLHFDPQNNKQM